MNIKNFIVPYILSVSTLLSCVFFSCSKEHGHTNNSDNTNFSQAYTMSFDAIQTDYDLNKYLAEDKASKLVKKYINNAVNGTLRIIENKKKTNYSSAVRQELPGAPANTKYGTLHCLYGQYTQLNRAISQLGDSIQIIPKTSNAHMATSSFKHQMSKLYNNAEYPNAIYRGHLYLTDDAYNTALNKYLAKKTQGKTDNLDSLYQTHTKEFQKDNFCTSCLNPGTIVIVSSGHAVMYLGQGRIENKQFVPDKNGQAICCSYNSEQSATYLSTWNTDKAFAADIQNIATQKYYHKATQQTR